MWLSPIRNIFFFRSKPKKHKSLFEKHSSPLLSFKSSQGLTILFSSNSKKMFLNLSLKPFLKIVKKFIREITITDNKTIFNDSLLPFFFPKRFFYYKIRKY